MRVLADASRVPSQREARGRCATNEHRHGSSRISRHRSMGSAMPATITSPRPDRPPRMVGQATLFCCLLALVVGMRLDSFRHTVLDPDEAIYVLMAESVVAGRTPYTEVWDHKPPGIYFLFAVVQRVCGRSIAALRLVTCLAVTISAFLLLCCGRFVLRRPAAGYVAAAIYAAFSTANGGLAANTEIFFTPFVVSGFYLLRRAQDGRHEASRNLLLGAAGASFGIAAGIKYVVFFELCAAAAVLVLEHRRSLEGAAAVGRAGYMRDVARLGAAALVVPVLTTVYFYGRGHLTEDRVRERRRQHRACERHALRFEGSDTPRPCARRVLATRHPARGHRDAFHHRSGADTSAQGIAHAMAMAGCCVDRSLSNAPLLPALLPAGAPATMPPRWVHR